MSYRNKIQRIPTGSNNLDNMLLGGIETHAITEFFGPGGAGKTQLCHTLAVISTLDKRLEKRGKVLHIDTEAKFRPERLVSIAQARDLDFGLNTSWLSDILCLRAMNVHQQELTLENAVVPLLEKERKNEKQKKVALLIVDSVINNYRSEFLGQGMLPQRQQKLYRFMCLLSTVSQNYGIAVVVTNQVNSSEANSIFWGSSATGGNVMAYTSTIRVSLTRLPNGNKIAASIIKSSYHLENQTCLMVSEKGIEDPMNIRAFVTSS